MNRIPSRLHRKLSPEGRPLFSLKVGDETYDDNLLGEITINRGASGYSYGLQPSTLSTTIAGLFGSMHNAHVELKLQPWAAAHIQSLSNMPPDRTEWRFYGRVGIQDSVDNGDGRKSYTSISASSYSTLLKPTTRTYLVRDRTPVLSIIRNILEHPALPNRLRTFPGAYGEEVWDESYFDAGGRQEMTFSEILEKYVEKQLILICERRDGQMHAQSLYLRERYLIDRASDRYAPLRSHTLQPATWKQPLEARSSNLILKQREPDGNITYTTWGSGTIEQTNEYPIESEEIDLTHVRSISDTNLRVMRALNYQKNVPRVQISSVKFDLLMMFSSKEWYDRRTAAELLRLEHGDAVYFSGDWQRQVRFPMIAQEIRETIGPNKWEIEIELQHPTNLLGLHDIPVHKPRVWNQLDTEVWDTDPNLWDEY